MQYTLPPDGQTSEMFWDAQDRAYGSVYVECRCGIDHYAVDTRNLYGDDPEFPEESDTVRHHGDCVSIGHFEFIGQTFVYGCEGCSKVLRRYEDFIWSERETIRNYLKIRIDQQKKWADQEHLKNLLSGIE